MQELNCDTIGLKFTYALCYRISLAIHQTADSEPQNRAPVISNRAWLPISCIPTVFIHFSCDWFDTFIPPCQRECWECSLHCGCVVRGAGGWGDSLRYLLHSDLLWRGELCNRSETVLHPPTSSHLCCPKLRELSCFSLTSTSEYRVNLTATFRTQLGNLCRPELFSIQNL